MTKKKNHMEMSCIHNIRHILQGNKRIILNRVDKLPEPTRAEVRQWYKTWPVEVFSSKGGNVII